MLAKSKRQSEDRAKSSSKHIERPCMRDEPSFLRPRSLILYDPIKTHSSRYPNSDNRDSSLQNYILAVLIFRKVDNMKLDRDPCRITKVMITGVGVAASASGRPLLQSANRGNSS